MSPQTLIRRRDHRIRPLTAHFRPTGASEVVVGFAAPPFPFCRAVHSATRRTHVCPHCDILVESIAHHDSETT